MVVDDSDMKDCVRLLQEIRDGQKLQLERQAEALTLQREQVALVQGQVERTERIQDRAERIQAAGARLVGGARIATAILVPIILALIAYVSWLLFSRFNR
jgi:hypothetical protein